MSKRKIVIGDVHGHYQALVQLLEVVGLSSDDQVYFLGDLVDRGPDSASVVQLVIENDYACIKGNHEQLLLESLLFGDLYSQTFQGWLKSGGHNTLLSYNGKIPQDHLDWLETLPIYLDLGDVFLVHAGLDPTLALEQQTQKQCCWIRESFHRMSQPYFKDKLIIVGHTMTFNFPNVIAGEVIKGVGWLDIDTGAYHPKSGWLSALDISNEVLYQVHISGKNQKINPLFG